MRLKFLVIATLVSASLFTGCYYNKEEILYPNGAVPCTPPEDVKFSVDVLTVMNNNCNYSGCHNTTSAASGVILDTYAGVKAQAANGRLLGSLNQTAGYAPMPKGNSKLSACTIATINQWILAGTPNN